MAIINNLFKLVKRFKNSIIEIGYCLLLTGITCYFVEDPSVAATFIIATLSVIGINILARRADSLLSHSINPVEKSLKQQFISLGSRVCRAISSFNLALLFGISGAVLIHEGGHVAAASMLYADSQPLVTMDGILEASTSWQMDNYTALGAWLGPLKTSLIVAGAGVFAIVCFASLGILVSLKIEKRVPKLSKCIFFSSVLSVLTQVNYGFSAFFTDQDDFGHDFMHLWQGGIHPILSIACLVAIPLTAYVIYQQWRKLKKIDMSASV